MPQLIDLTHVITPNSTTRKFSIETIGADSVNKNVKRADGQWYIMTNIQMVSHIGTHIEVPYHLFPNGFDLASMPLEHFCGEAVLLDFSFIQKRIGITKEMAIEAANRVGGIRRHDILLCNLGYADLYGTDSYTESPYFLTETIQYFTDCGIKMMGVDAGGVELPATFHHENHSLLFSNQIPLIENLANLNKLTSSRFSLSAFPCSIANVEAFPVRVIAYLK